LNAYEKKKQIYWMIEMQN